MSQENLKKHQQSTSFFNKIIFMSEAFVEYTNLVTIRFKIIILFIIEVNGVNGVSNKGTHWAEIVYKVFSCQYQH